MNDVIKLSENLECGFNNLFSYEYNNSKVFFTSFLHFN